MTNEGDAVARTDDGDDDDKRSNKTRRRIRARMMRIAKESAGSGSVQSCRGREVRGWVARLRLGELGERLEKALYHHAVKTNGKVPV